MMEHLVNVCCTGRGRLPRVLVGGGLGGARGAGAGGAARAGAGRRRRAGAAGRPPAGAAACAGRAARPFYRTYIIHYHHYQPVYKSHLVPYKI